LTAVGSFVYCEKMDKKYFLRLAVKKYCCEAKAWLDKHVSDFAPGKSTVEKWFAKFKRGEMNIEDNARSGRSKEAIADENIKTVHKIILNDRKVKLIEIAETLKISKKRVEHYCA
jgi:transposase